jgi:hypothetical protein
MFRIDAAWMAGIVGVACTDAPCSWKKTRARKDFVQHMPLEEKNFEKLKLGGKSE